MEANSATSDGTKIDLLKWVVVWFVVGVAVVGNYHYDGSNLYRILGLVALTIVAALVAAQTSKGKAFLLLLRDARIEIRKVVWPTRPELVQTTLIVVAFVLVVALLLWLLDSLISFAVSLFIG